MRITSLQVKVAFETRLTGLIGHEAPTGRFGIFLAAGVSIDATLDGPLGKYRGAWCELAGLP
ncbi:hypothetical protein ACS2U0_27220, partial [Bacillus cereus group sp. BC251]|uniref:hypothetical protein n=1 Tax=Bacillus cereus group sp. BC251 TaxID=3445329 RepID=UPI003F229790